MHVELVVAHDKHKGTVVPVRSLPYVMGREASCHLRAASKIISHRHCELFEYNGRLQVRDLGSTNGTFVNKQRIDGEAELHHGDVLEVGPLAFVVKLKTAVTVDMPTPLPANKEPLPDEENVAALLMEMDAREEGNALSNSTTIEIPAPSAEESPKAAPASRPQPPARPLENSSDAAKAILAKYRRERK